MTLHSAFQRKPSFRLQTKPNLRRSLRRGRAFSKFESSTCLRQPLAHLAEQDGYFACALPQPSGHRDLYFWDPLEEWFIRRGCLAHLSSAIMRSNVAISLRRDERAAWKTQPFTNSKSSSLWRQPSAHLEGAGSALLTPRSQAVDDSWIPGRSSLRRGQRARVA